jgi:molecular chaperone DnaK
VETKIEKQEETIKMSVTRTTIDFGIDLGTTNSSIAVLNGMQVEVFKNNEGFEITSSAVWIDRNNRLYVGRTARERLETDPQNAFSEFKLQMGTDIDYVFERSHRRMKPEDLSAEVLKSLKGDAKRRTDEDLQAAVITVPAAFELPECDATLKAAQLAGFTQAPLIMEPVAAALSYGFQDESDRVYWMVYDFGGGTFDAALIQVRDGTIKVVNHGGDNHLGGKLIDWAIVDQLLIPAIVKEHRLKDFTRHNLKWRTAVAKLKQGAEQAKIRLSLDDTAEIFIENLYKDEKGKPREFVYELKRTDVQRLAEPFLLRSINICKEVLQQKRLGPADIEKVILVGGPTLMPLFRERLADPGKGLGIPLEFNVDPLTVVTRGAAIFAGGQKKQPTNGTVSPGQFKIILEYEPMGADNEPLVGGKVSTPNNINLQGYTIEFVNIKGKPQWRSGKLELSPEGTFMTKLWAEEGKENIYSIELTDAKGFKCKSLPDNITYKIGKPPTDPPLIHSVGVGLANNEMKWFFEKGQALPARRKVILKTVTELRKGDKEEVIRIPVKEGENKRANRNRDIGKLEIKEHQVGRTVPQGTEVEVIIKIDRDRHMMVNAYIPMLDEEYEDVVQLGYVQKDREKVKKEFEFEKNRLKELDEKAKSTGEENAFTVLDRIKGEKMLEDIEDSFQANPDDRDALDKGDKRLLDLQVALDEAEESLEWPSLAVEARGWIKTASVLIRKYGDTGDKKNLDNYCAEIEKHLQTREIDLLEQSISNLRNFLLNVLEEKDVLEMTYFEAMCQDRDKIPEPQQEQASGLIIQGQRAVNANDNEKLKDVNRRLSQLFPTPPPPPDREDWGTLIY